jgi:hypothetical protein
VIVGLFITTLTDRTSSFKAAGHRSRYFCRLQLVQQGSYTLLERKTFRATTYKQKEIEGNYLPPMPGLLTKKSVNKYYELQKSEDSA